AAGRLELAELLQAVGDRELVDWLALLVEVEHRGVDGAVRRSVEVVRLEVDLDRQRVERLLREQDGTEDRLLGLEVLRRHEAAGGRLPASVGVPVLVLADRHRPKDPRQLPAAPDVTAENLRAPCALPCPCVTMSA